MPMRDIHRQTSSTTYFLVLVSLFSLLIFLPQTQAQEDNVCRDTAAPVISYGETLTGVIDQVTNVSLFCFNAERGTDVTITVSPISQGLVPSFFAGTPFINSDGTFEDELLIEEIGDTAGNSLQGTLTIESDGTYLVLVQGVQQTQGSFSITLELSGGNVLGSNPSTDNAGTDGDTETNQSGETAPEGIANIIFGETDLCTTVITTQLVFGEAVDGNTNDTQPLFYCFEANEGDIITVDFTINAIPMGYFVVDPFYDGTQTAPVYAQNLVQNEGESVTSEFIAPRDGQYVVIVVAAIPESGDYTLSVDAVAGNIYDCTNEPLASLVSQQWGASDENGAPLIEINIACSERLAFAALGGSIVVPYSVSQDDEFFFVYQNRLYVTTSLTDSEWVIEREDGQSYTFQPLTEAETCSDERLSQLISGSWFWQLDPSQSIFLDFTCNGIVILDDQQSEAFTASYDLTEDQITIQLGEQPVVFENVTITEEIMFIEFTGTPFEIRNTLFEAPDEASDE